MGLDATAVLAGRLRGPAAGVEFRAALAPQLLSHDERVDAGD